MKHFLPRIQIFPLNSARAGSLKVVLISFKTIFSHHFHKQEWTVSSEPDYETPASPHNCTCNANGKPRPVSLLERHFGSFYRSLLGDRTGNNPPKVKRRFAPLSYMVHLETEFTNTEFFQSLNYHCQQHQARRAAQINPEPGIRSVEYRCLPYRGLFAVAFARNPHKTVC